MPDGQVVFEITADGKHAIANVKDVTKAIENEAKKWDSSAKKSTNNIEDHFSGMLKKLVAGFSAVKIGKELLDIGTAAIEAASDLREVQNVVDVTFGESAGTIEKWAKTAGEQFGLTETQAKKFTSTLGAMMKSAGMSGNEIVEMSTDLAGLAADMASFYNLDFDTAFQKIRSGISGETEPLKQLGVNMSVANLEAFALEKGITKAFNAMSQSEQTMLRYQYLMQATADAQGDFARTSDGFANASRRVETAMNTIKTKGGDLLLSVIEPLTSKFATFLEQLTSEPEHTVLDDFANIDLETGKKMQELQGTYNKASDIIKLIDEIEKKTVTLKDGSTITFAELFKDIGNVEKNGGDVKKYIEELGLDVDFINQKYQVWKESTKQLTSLVPSLTDVIDKETGAINGGTEALQKNLDEWRANEEKKIAWAAYYAKERALAEKQGNMFMYEFDAGAARQAAERARRELKKQFDEVEFDAEGKIITTPSIMNRNGELTNAELQLRKKWVDTSFEYQKLLDEEIKSKQELERQTNDYSAAEEQLADGKAALIEKYGEEADAAEYAADVTSDFLGQSEEEWQKLTGAVNESVKELADYVQSVHDATEASVNSTLNGFTKVKTAAEQYKEQVNKAQELEKELRESGKYTEKEIKIKVDAANAQVTLNGLNESLQSQLDFIKEYEANLQKARELGVSDEVLASLADGSNESALQLHAITEAYKEWSGEGVPEDIQQLNELFKEVSDSKGTFTDTLTQQKLTVDQTYDAMVQKAMTSIEELNLSEEAATAMGNTIDGIAIGISNEVPAVAAAVDAVLAELDRLSGYGMTFSFDENGNIQFNLDGSNAKGLDYVPFDGYLSELHEGEGILTAEENRIWQRFKSGQHTSSNVDYDAIGGVVRDNVKPGGSVYLDGRVVGQVISQMQGSQYRTMKRSGFQG